MANDVWALAEINGGKLASISLQLASKAAELAGTLGGSSAAVALGTNTQVAAADLGACGVQTVYASEGSVYDEYLTQPHVEALAALIQQHQPRLVLFGGGRPGDEYAGRLWRPRRLWRADSLRV